MYEVLLSNKFCSLKFKGDNTFFEYCICDSERTIDFSYPVLEIEGKTEQIRINHWRKPVLIEKNRNGMNEYLLKGISSNSGILMNLYIHILDESPVIRFRYELFSELTCWLTKNSAKDNNTYFGVGLTGFENFKEVSLSEFEALPYSSLAADSETVQSSFESSNLHLGTMFLACEKDNSFFLSYEKSLQNPGRILQFQSIPVPRLDVQFIAANSLYNQIIRKELSFGTLWFETGGVAGGEEILTAGYRDFMVKCMEKTITSAERA